MDRGAWWATVHGAAESDMTEHIYLDALASDFHSLFYVCIFNLASEGKEGQDFGQQESAAQESEQFDAVQI